MKPLQSAALLWTLFSIGLSSHAAEMTASRSPFVETNFPFFSSVLDARRLGEGWPAGNLTPRGLILNLGHDLWACFDVDLLRVSAVWTGKGVTPVSMSQGSYFLAGDKAPEGQDKLPVIDGIPWFSTGIYPGWQSGEVVSGLDPREPGPDPKEVGLGPLPPSRGRFKAVRLTETGVCLEYEVAGAFIREWLEARVQDGLPQMQRRFLLNAVPGPLWLLLGKRPSAPGESPRLKFDLQVLSTDGNPTDARLEETAEGTAVRVPASGKAVEFSVAISLDRPPKAWGTGSHPPSARSASAPQRWPQVVTTRGVLASGNEAYVLDSIPLPQSNPWGRHIRMADVAFFDDGRAAVVTFDGDVWIVSSLTPGLEAVRWKRFASGLHEPLGMGIRSNAVFVFDRNGIWRLRDTDGNAEADVHELVSNAFGQTAETREYANGMKLAPDGSFVIAKGGQQGSSIGKHNGSVLRIGADGSSVEVLAYGLRQPFIGVHPRTGLVTASDQQGHYVPSTPLYIIQGGQYHGFLSLLLPKEKYPAPIADPLTWIPHSINASGAGQVWLADAKMGSLNGALIHFGYYRPEIFLVRTHARGSRPQAAVMSLTRQVPFPPLNGAVGPHDGQLYIAGFQIWGTEAAQISGLARLRHTGKAMTLPREIVAMDKGFLLRFDVPLDRPAAVNPDNFSAERWNYARTANYGSPHFKLDGSKGQEALVPTSAYLSVDGRSVFIGFRDMRPVMQMRLGWSLTTLTGERFEQNAYLTPYDLSRFEPSTEGFGALSVNLEARQSRVETLSTLRTPEEGKRLAELMGCVACHSTDGTTLGKVGPSWKGLFGSERALAGGAKIQADENYIRESIKEPTVKIAAGFDKSDTGMPSYEGVLSEAQIDALTLYIKTIR